MTHQFFSAILDNEGVFGNFLSAMKSVNF